jgi:hypothetical protein
MARIEDVELRRHSDEIVGDAKNLIEKWRAIFDWDVPDIDQSYADRVIISEVRKALDKIEQELTK